ncbi:hypothetical protein CGCF415_v013790 [Colletotrichum fructicola]|nr:hypothetical protein CGCFRS4_v015128 [Colletotrichum fructicola]KAF4890180.1 hypothetical protein CGCF415_v013790 [Colletotrichum fructicola]KAF4932195.1 hypothetical protein CGCF245_v010857 [Colletotrichum fructicola]
MPLSPFLQKTDDRTFSRSCLLRLSHQRSSSKNQTQIRHGILPKPQASDPATSPAHPHQRRGRRPGWCDERLLKNEE